MSILLEMAMFPTDTVGSKSKEVSEIIKIIKQSGFDYQLTSMATIIETRTLKEALNIVEQCYERLEELGCARIYAVLKFDIRTSGENRIKSKITSVEKHIGEVFK